MLKFFSVSVRTIISMVLIALVGLYSLKSQDWEFRALATFFHDLRIQWDSKSKESEIFRTLTLAPQPWVIPHERLLGAIEEIQKSEPRAIILALSPSRLGKDPIALKKLALNFRKFEKLFLFSSVGATADFRKGFREHAFFRDFPRAIRFRIARDVGVGGNDGRNRRILLQFNGVHNDESLLLKELRSNFGFDVSPEQFEHSFNFMNTQQIFVRYRGPSFFGQFDPLALSASERSELKGKIAILGEFDELGMAERSIYRTFATESEGFKNGLFEPFNEVLANMLESVVTNDYVKVPTIRTEQLFIFISLSLLILLLIWAPPVYSILSFIPILMLVFAIGHAVFLATHFMLDVSRVFVAMLVIQYGSLPLLLIRILRDWDRRISLQKIEDEKAILMNRLLAKTAQAEAGLKISLQVAHDIRSPIMAINVVTEVAKNLLPAEQLKLLIGAVGRLNSMSEDLLGKFRGTSNLLIEPTRLTDLRTVIEEALEQFRGVWSAIEIHKHLTDKAIPCSGQANKWKELILNILTNSAQALESRKVQRSKELNGVQDSSLADFWIPTIHVSIREQASFIELEISDNGPGIKSELKSILFQRGATLGKEQGTGLGLAMAKEYLKSLGGDIRSVENVGSGACLKISCPREQVQKLKLKKLILAADDNAEMLKYWVQIANRLNLQIETFGEPHSVIKRIQELTVLKTEFSLLTDLIFEGFDQTGFDVIQSANLRSESKTVWLCTSIGNQIEVRDLAKKLGAQVISKDELGLFEFESETEP